MEGYGASNHASLPFTGVDLVLYVIVGCGILLAGLLLRRYSAKR